LWASQTVIAVMATYFISRHPGARQWAAARDIRGTWVEHLDPCKILAGDQVIGTLPVNLAADVCRRGARYWHLAMHVPRDARGQELSADQMASYGATLVSYLVQTDSNPPLLCGFASQANDDGTTSVDETAQPYTGHSGA